MKRWPWMFVAVLLLIPLRTRVGNAAPAEGFYRAIRTNDLAAVESLITQHADLNAQDGEGIPPLMHAAAFGSLAAMQRLLQAGADVNATSRAGSTALMWSTREIGKVRLLLAHGADVNAKSKAGRTALLIACMSDESADVVKLLLARGADTKVADAMGMTPLHAATYGNDTDTIRAILATKPDVTAQDSAAYTPLMSAAAWGNAEAIRLLLAAGARVNDASDVGDLRTHNAGRVKNGRLALSKMTPLLLASIAGPSDAVRRLLDAGADVNARDGRGMTPLMLAAAVDHADPDVVKLLLSRGADVNAASTANETALDWAKKFGDTPIAAMIAAAGGKTTPKRPMDVPAPAPSSAAEAFNRGSAILGKASGSFFAKGGCTACHAQNIMDVVRASAAAKGVAVDTAAGSASLTQTRNRLATAIPQLLERIDVPGTPDVPNYAMLGMESAGQKPDPTTDATAVNLAAQQLRDGNWHFPGLARAPMADGDFTRTALSAHAVAVYAPPARADLRAVVDRARQWLLTHTPATNEDRNFRLLGLKWTGAESSAVARAADAVLASQRADGGWAQRQELTSDAYATGQTLWALVMSGAVTPAAPAYSRGVRFLTSTQRADGSWYVASRSVKFQPYFESGFPYGDDQWISMMATGWSSAALAFALPAANATGAR